MFSVPHLVVLFIVVLVFFGPHKLPELARGLGKLMAEFRKASNDFKMAFEEEMRNIERQNREAEWKKSQEASEAKRHAELTASTALSDSTPASTSEPKILPEHAATPDHSSLTGTSLQTDVIDPVVSPVSEAVPRDSASEMATPENAAPEDHPIDVPAEEATSSDADASASTPSAAQPIHDHRQPA